MRACRHLRSPGHSTERGAPATAAVRGGERVMTTQLKRFTEAYAVMTIAVYEPLIARWYSKQGFATIAQGLVRRAVSANGSNGNGNRSVETAASHAYGIIGTVSEE